jgi:hypothetical protein
MADNAPITGSRLAGDSAAGVCGLTSEPGPIVVLTYAHAGAELLTEMLSASKSLVCTSGTGVLPLCHTAATSWNRAESRAGSPSTLAIRSIHALVGTMITIIEARAGASRWCETAVASTEAASSFLKVFPATKFLCLYRALRGVLAEGHRTYQWGLGGSPFWAYAGSHPGDNVATIAAYWADRTEALLRFEASHLQSCLRVKYENVSADRALWTDEIYSYLGLTVDDRVRSVTRHGTTGSATGVVLEPEIAVAQVPASLLTRVNDLHARLGYSPFL